MRGNISVPEGVISGAFNVHIAFEKPVTGFSKSNIRVETLSGQPLGHPSDRFGGSGKDYHLLCYPPENSVGESRVTLQGKVTVLDESNEQIALENVAAPREIMYDTMRFVTVTFGEALRVGDQVRLPLTLSAPVIGLKKKHFVLPEIPGMKTYLYGADAEYELVFVVPTGADHQVLTVSVGHKQVRKKHDALVDLFKVPLQSV